MCAHTLSYKQRPHKVQKGNYFSQAIKTLLRSIPWRTLSLFSVLMQSVHLLGFFWAQLISHPAGVCGMPVNTLVLQHGRRTPTPSQESSSAICFPAIPSSLILSFLISCLKTAQRRESTSCKWTNPAHLHPQSPGRGSAVPAGSDRCLNPAQAHPSYHTHQLHTPVCCPSWIFFSLTFQVASDSCFQVYARLLQRLEFKCWLLSFIVSPHPLGHQYKPNNSFPVAVTSGIFKVCHNSGCWPFSPDQSFAPCWNKEAASPLVVKDMTHKL